MDRHKTTYSSMVPTMFNRFMNFQSEVFETYDVSSMRCLIQSSAPIPFPTKQWVIGKFSNAGLHEFNGGTEVGVVTYLAPEEQLERPGSIGRALPVVEINLSGGENIYPAEIETVLYGNQKILEAAVIGVPDDDWGEAVKAVLVLKEGTTATADEIILYCREHLAGYKIPRSVDFVDQLPKTDTGKILKKIIKAHYWKDREVKI